MPMEAGDWSNPDARAVMVAVGDGALIVNAWWEPLTFRLPAAGPWSVELDTADPGTRRAVADTLERVMPNHLRQWQAVSATLG
jgi:hypothetical protein